MMPCTEVTGSNEFFFYNVLAEIFFFYKTEILKTGSPSRNRRHKKHSTFISSSSRLLNHEIFPQKPRHEWKQSFIVKLNKVNTS